jgi:hypothetical protein
MTNNEDQKSTTTDVNWTNSFCGIEPQINRKYENVCTTDKTYPEEASSHGIRMGERLSDDNENIFSA